MARVRPPPFLLTLALLAAPVTGCGASARVERPPAVGMCRARTESAPVDAPTLASAPLDLRDAELPDVCAGSARRLQVRGGTAAYESGLGEGFVGELEVEPIAAVDLDADGVLEHLALVRCAPGGSGTLDALWAFHADAGVVSAFAHIEGGDRADGGLDGARIVNRAVIVGRYSGEEEGLCCPTHLTDETWRLVRGAFVREHVGPTRAFHQD